MDKEAINRERVSGYRDLAAVRRDLQSSIPIPHRELLELWRDVFGRKPLREDQKTMRLERAIGHFSNVIHDMESGKADPEMIAADYMLRSIAYQALGRPQPALDDVAAGLDLVEDPDAIASLVMWQSVINFTAGNYPMAMLDIYNELLGGRDHFLLHEIKAHYHYRLGDYVKARESLARMDGLEPVADAGLETRAALAMIDEDYELARRLSNHAVWHNRRHVAHLVDNAIINMKTGHEARAKLALWWAARADPGKPAVDLGYAVMRQEQGKFAEAREHYARAASRLLELERPDGNDYLAAFRSAKTLERWDMPLAFDYDTLIGTAKGVTHSDITRTLRAVGMAPMPLQLQHS